jgi:glycosyltransferase involved in cell wall biosynthesis
MISHAASPCESSPLLPDGEQASGGTPVLSIGVPVYNDAEHIGHALQSLLDQDFRDYELVVSDNCSTDGTLEICQEFARRDSRIRLVRHNVNRGLAYNWNFLAENAQGRYFKWACSNDYCGSRFLSTCINALDSDQRAVLAYTRAFILANEDDSKTDVYETLYGEDRLVLSSDPATRFLSARRYGMLNNALQGVMRLEKLRQTRLLRTYPHGDWPLMCELAVRGKFVRLEERLFYRRMSVKTSSVRRFGGSAEYSKYIDPSSGVSAYLPESMQQVDLVLSACRAPIGLFVKLRLLLRLMVGAARRWRQLWSEILGVIKHVLQKLRRAVKRRIFPGDPLV